MATPTLTSQQLQEIRDFAAQWGRIVARRAFPDGGSDLLDMDLFALEQVATAAAHGLTEGTLATLLELQAQALPTEVPCPDCGRACVVGPDPRPLVAHGGELTYAEPRCHCPACRRDFFPSAGHATPG